MKFFASETIAILKIKLSVIIIVVFGLCPIMITGINYIMPNFMIIMIYFWGIYDEKNILPIEFFTIISLFDEFMKEELFGLVTIINLCFFLIIKKQKRYFIGKSFYVVMIGFIVFLTFYFLLLWIIYNLVIEGSFPNHNFIMKWLMTILSYCLFHQFFYVLNSNIGREKNKISSTYLG